jgi:hypothetical protein
MQGFMVMARTLILVLFVCWVGLAPIHAAITIDGYTASTNDRFTNSNSFIASQFNLSGIGRTNGQWATLIAPNVVVSAFHAKPATGSVVSFYASNDPDGTPVQRTVTAANQKIGSTDLWIGVLDSNVPSSLRTFAFSNTLLSGAPPVGSDFSVGDAGVFQGANAYLVGLSPTSHISQQSQAFGRNRITGYSENVPFLSNTDNDSLIMDYDSNSSSNWVQYESRFVGGDSGAPMFVEYFNSTTQQQDLMLLGTNAFIDDNGTFSGINYIGNQAAFINNFISISAVPEPGSMTLALGCVIGISVARFRRKAKLRC